MLRSDGPWEINPQCFAYLSKILNVRTSTNAAFSCNFKKTVVRCFMTCVKRTWTPKEIKRTKMLFGNRWVDKTRPHNLLADWSQEEKKSNTRLQRTRWIKRQHTWEQKYLCINWCVTFLYSGRPFPTSTSTRGCSKIVHEYADVCQLLCIACILYSTEPRCFCVQTDFQRLRQNYEGLHTHITFIQTHTHVSPLPCHSRKEKKKKPKQKLKHNSAHNSSSFPEWGNKLAP